MVLLITEILTTIFMFIVLYFTFLFLIIFLSDRKKLNSSPKMEKFPSLSIIIPAYNEEGTIVKTVETIRKLKYPRGFGIVVVDDGSTDETYEVARKIKGIRILRQEHGGKARALNFALKKAGGEIVACVDSDSYPETDTLMKTIPFFSDKQVAAVTTSIYAKEAKNMMQRLQRIEYILIAFTRKLLESINAIYCTPGPMSFYRKNVLIDVGGFDEKNLTEDIEIAWRLLSRNHKIKMSLDSKVYTNVPQNIHKWWRQRLRWNMGGTQTTLKYMKLFFKKGFGNIGTFVLPFFFIAYIVTFMGLVVSLLIIASFLNYLIGAGTYGFNLIRPFLIAPDIIFFWGLFLFAISVVFIKINARSIKESRNVRRSFLDYFTYLFFYTSIFPINLIHSIFKLLRKDYKW